MLTILRMPHSLGGREGDFTARCLVESSACTYELKRVGVDNAMSSKKHRMYAMHRGLVVYDTTISSNPRKCRSAGFHMESSSNDVLIVGFPKRLIPEILIPKATTKPMKTLESFPV